MDEIVFDMSSQSEGTPSVFTKKDWLSILDNQNQNYQGNQSVLDTSQLANSNKFLNYREAYLTLPMIITMTSTPTIVNGTTVVGSIPAPATAATSQDFTVGLKNWYGSLIHSFTCDYNGTTIIQQTPYIGLWNTFKLMTSLSVDDLTTQGSSIGFFPDTASSMGVVGNANSSKGVAFTECNNQNLPASLPNLVSVFNEGTVFNEGMFRRQLYTNIDPDGIAGNYGATYGQLQQGSAPYGAGTATANNWNILWKGYIFKKTNAVAPFALGVYTGPATINAVWQLAITGQVMLKHLHAFFERVPLLKGVFMKLTLNLNQSSVSFTTTTADSAGAGSATAIPTQATYSAVSVQSPLGGVSPLMLAHASGTTSPGSNFGQATHIVSIFAGNRCLNSSQNSNPTLNPISNSPMSGSILLNVPAYSFNPVFESSYLSSPVKKIIYTDVYQYQVLGVGAGQVYNNLVTNGIANIKSVLVLPFYSATLGTTVGTWNPGNGGLIPFQSPFSPAGGGPTSPMCLMTQFNIQISGQNAIYNTQRYEYEQFMNQFKGYGSMNGGQEDGCSSGLVGQFEFDNEYNYYYVNCGRMLPVEEAVPKSVNILGTNTSGKNIDMYIFVEYGVEVNVDILTGARV